MDRQRPRFIGTVIALACVAGLICHPAWAAPPAASSSADSYNGPTLIRSTDAKTDAPPARAAEDSDDGDSGLVRMVDPDTPLTERRKIFAIFEHHAEMGDYYDQYIVGSIYRLGEHGAVPIVPRDLAKARRYLGNAAVNGYRTAMAKMAELELSDHHPLDAMVWAQIYAYYTEAKHSSEDKRSLGYLGELLHRISEQLHQDQMPTVVDDVNQFIANYDARIRAGRNHIDAKRSKNGFTRTHAPETFNPRHYLASGVADYVVVYRPDGSADRAWLIDALPTPAEGRQFRVLALSTRITPDPNAGGLRAAAFPVVFANGSYTIR